MKRSHIAGTLISAAILSAFWAYTVMDTLIRDLSKDVTYIDLAVLFVLGLVSGIALGLAYAFGRKTPDAK